MNEHDSERVAGLFAADGMVAAASLDEADVVFLNTCCIRENADDRLYGTLGHLKAAKTRRPGLRIVVGGCLAQKDRDLVRARAPWVDVVFGTHNLHRVLDLLDQAEEWGPVTEIHESRRRGGGVPSDLPAQRELAHSAWVTITVGLQQRLHLLHRPHRARPRGQPPARGDHRGGARAWPPTGWSR